MAPLFKRMSKTSWVLTRMITKPLKVLFDKLNPLLKNIDPLLNWWFAGVLVIFYWISTNVFGWEGEPLEWMIYIFAFVFALVYFLLNMRGRFTFNPIAMAILSVPKPKAKAEYFLTSIPDILRTLG